MKKNFIAFLIVSLLAACGSQNEESSPAPINPEAQAAELAAEVPADVMTKVPLYVMQRTNNETGVVDYAYTNEAPKHFADLSSEEAKLAYGKSEQERFARATPVSMKTLESDEDIDLTISSESFWAAGGGIGFRRGGFGFGFGGFGGCGGFGNFGFGNFGLNGFWGGGGLGGSCFNPCFNPCASPCGGIGIW